MVARLRPTTAPKTNALNRVSLFGPVPVLEGEDAKAYDTLLARVSGDVTPIQYFRRVLGS